jgi:hypothetical protein
MRAFGRRASWIAPGAPARLLRRSHTVMPRVSLPASSTSTAASTKVSSSGRTKGKTAQTSCIGAMSRPNTRLWPSR